MASKLYLMHLRVLILITGLCVPRTDSDASDPYSAQPRVVIQNGHLIFQTGENHNITFASTRGGSIQVNSEDLVTIVQQAKTSARDIQQFGASRINDLDQTVQDIRTQFEPISNIASRFSELQNNLTITAYQVSQMKPQLRGQNRPSRLRQKLAILAEKVNNLVELLTTNECASNPCQNGGTCIDLYNKYWCQCVSGWEGPTCGHNVNECVEYADTYLGCQHGATCNDFAGGYSCTCTANWHGVHCNEQHDDCSGASQQELCGHGSCVNVARSVPGQPKYKCICEQGWTSQGSDPACSHDIDECIGSQVSCSRSPPVHCINLLGSFACGPCPAGYTGNGFYCNDINECAINNGGCSIAPMVQCINSIGSRTCGPCPPGYNGNGVVCVFTGLCQINNGGCHPQATCVENTAISVTNRECHCPSGYSGSGIGPNGCARSQGTPCESNPCLNGRCQVTGSSYRCICNAGYTGSLCENMLDACHSNPCRNGGTCIAHPSGFTCSCTSEWQGMTCDERTESCGGELYDAVGTLAYPRDRTRQYPHGVSCAWMIYVSNRSKALNLTFTEFHLEETHRCAYDFLQINDGPDSTSRLIGRFCGHGLPGNGTLITTHNQVYIWFKSDASVAGDGFQIMWTTIDPICGKDLAIADHGSIQSPGYPGNYPHSRDCYWKVRVPYGFRIRFQFAQFGLEHHENCSYDFLKIYDGLSENDPVLKTYCGIDTNHPPIITSGPTAMLYFHSDDSLSDIGFHIVYSKDQAVAGCGGFLTHASGEFHSPNYPNVYSENLRCEWLIRLHPNERIQLNFTSFDVEDHANCAFDYVLVINGEEEGDDIIGRYCNTIRPPVLMSSSNKMRIIFATDYSIGRHGFQARYTTACGGTYTAISGEVHSPNYPDYYPLSKTCYFSINVPNGNIIEATFPFFDIEDNFDCQYDYLELRDGSETGEVIGNYCGAQFSEVIHTTYNQLSMKFVSDGSIQNRGFLMNYTSIERGCGGILTDNHGTFGTPNSLTEEGFATCNWLLRAQAGFIVKLNFLTFMLRQDDETCSHEYVEVFDSTGIRINRFCGEQMPPALTSTDNEMKVTFRTIYQTLPNGFSASYVYVDSSHACGGNFYTESGVVKSPRYPENYPHNRDCIWKLHVANNRRITINVTSFLLEIHPDCNYDFLEIRNGGNENSPLIGKYCGNRIAQRFTSHSNTLWIHFVSDYAMSARGFEIVYESTVEGCGGVLVAAEGSLESPNYPNAYYHNAECNWKIQVAQGSVIRILIEDVDIENHPSCGYDYLQIFDGDSENADSLIKVCTTSQEFQPIVSTGNFVFIKFQTDYSQSGRGFQLAYKVVCNNVLKGHRGVIESPNFPSPYSHNLNCTWQIEAPIGNNISIAFSHLAIEFNAQCEYDSLEVLEEKFPDPPRQLAKYCGRIDSLPEPLLTTVNKAIIRFISDPSVAYGGFRLEWKVEGCGGILTRNSATITSPNYPGSYPMSVSCLWYITVSPGEKIEFTIEHIDLEAHSDCNYDYIKVIGGNNDSSVPMGTFCGRMDRPQVVVSHGNQMVVKFFSDYSLGGMGFSARYVAAEGGCGGLFRTESGNIMSPNYAGNYSKDDDCTWLIEVHENHLVQLTIEDFDISPLSPNCSSAFLKVFDGENENEHKLLNHCGSNLPSTTVYTSTSNKLFLHMKADGVTIAKGFKASFKTVCGAKILADNGGEIKSPNYPHLSNTALSCSWIVYASDLGEKVSLTITDIALHETVNCTYEYVIVRSGMEPTSPILQQICGHSSPPPIISPGNALHISFSGSIFRATYAASTTACGGDLFSEHGTFSSPGYPDSYPIDTECIWNISASMGNRIELSFSTFDIEQSDHCNIDYVEIREDGSSGPVIGRFCGSSSPNNLTTIAGRFWVKLRSGSSDISGSRRRFIAHYSLVHGVELNGTEGIIESPGYPRYLYRDDTFTWQITVPAQWYIKIELLLIDMEESAHGYCSSSLSITDGAGQYGIEIGRYCSRTLPAPVVTTSSVAVITYHNGYTNGRWRLRWTATSESAPSPQIPSGDTCLENIYVNSTNVTIQSPGYPFGYATGLLCTWIITSEQYRRVKIDFVNIDIEGYSFCYYDKLEVYDASLETSESWNKLATLCGHSPPFPSFNSSSRYMKLVFSTDYYFNRTGFKANVHSECGGKMFSSSGILNTSDAAPSYGRPSCNWVIIARPGRKIRVHFDEFNIPGDDTCSRQYILLRNGGEATSPFLGSGKYCNQNSPGTLETNSNQLYIQLTSEYRYHTDQTTPVFRLHYGEVSVGCGGQIHLTTSNPTTIIISPNHPNPPPHDIECEWIVMGPASTRLRLDFNAELDMARGCHEENKTEFLEFRDGGTVNSEIMATYCGRGFPESVFSTANILSVRYVTTATNPHSGFNATIQIAECGGMYYGYNNTVTSPNYPSNYDNNIECIWSIRTSKWRMIKIYFEHMDIADNPESCLNDYLEFRETDSSGSLIGRTCGSVNISDIWESEENIVFVKFKSNSTGSGKGFKLRFISEGHDCGGELRNPSGVITSPSYLQPTNKHHYCVWQIFVEEGRIITFTFDAFFLRQDPTTHKCLNGLKIWNGTDSYWDVTEKQMYCGSMPAGSIDTSDNTGTVSYFSHGNVAGEGFQLTYSSDKEPVCGGKLSSSLGTFSSPGFENGTYNNTIECTWRLRSESQGVSTLAVQFDVLEFAANSTQNCLTDYIVIQEGDLSRVQASSPRFCGNLTAQKIFISTPSPGLLIGLRRNSTQPSRGFNASYIISECGGEIEFADSVIESPHYQTNNPVVCHWRLNAQPGEQIKLSFTDFDLESDCTKDYVEIWNGKRHDSPILGKYCGNQRPNDITSESNHLTLVYSSDGIGPGGSFRLTSTVVDSGCGGILRSDSGTFSSPRIPNAERYPNNVECIWILEIDTDFHHNISFVGRFDIETADNCVNDYVQVDDLVNRTWTSLNKFCGINRPPDVIGTSNQMRVTFHSNEQIQGDGFTIIHTAECGRTFSTEKSGVISSPGFPRNYFDNLNCKFIIQAAPNEYIVLTFDERFFIEDHPNCKWDYLKVFAGKTTSSPQIGNFCGNSVPDPIISRNAMMLHFYSDYIVTRIGFMATFEVHECGGRLTGPHGRFRTAGSPQGYAPNMDCTWYITVDPDRVIELKFLYFELESSCYHDYVVIYRSSHYVGRFCGSSIPPVIKSEGPNLTVNFRSDRDRHYKGFEAVYRATYGEQQGCGGVARNASGEISSLDFNGDGIYESGVDCIWYINEQRELVRITFNFMDIEAGPSNSSNCPNDYLEIRDGFSPFDPVLGRFCGTQLPSDIISNAGRVMLHFHTDFTEERRGFRLSYSQEEPTCGGSVYVSYTPETITSPNYPQPYEPNLRCRWQFYTNGTSPWDSIELAFHELDIPCGDDYIEVRNGVDRRTIHLCGENSSQHYSANNGFTLYFVTDTEGAGKGFSLSYYLAGCSRNYTKDNAVIYSRGYPRHYYSGATCEIGIQAPEGYTISLYFNYLQIGYQRGSYSNCGDIGMEIFEGNDANGYKVGTFCSDATNPVFSRSNALLLRVRESVSPRFAIQYTTTNQGSGCGGNLTSINSTFTSPRFPMPCNISSACSWYITVPGDHTMTLTFEIFQLNSTRGCDTNFVEIYEAHDELESNRVARYCGTDHPAAHSSQGSMLTVKLVTSTNNNAPGFKASFYTNSLVSP